MRALETRLERDKSILAPGCKFVLLALLELFQTCGVINGHSFSDTQTPFVSATTVNPGSSLHPYSLLGNDSIRR